MKSINYNLKPQDLVVLLKIITLKESKWFQHTLAEGLKISQSEVSECLARSKYSGLLSASGKKVNILSLLDFISYGLKYTFPQQPGIVTRGLPTAHSALPLSEHIQSENAYVWPYAKGKVRGQAIEPLYKSVPEAMQNNPELHQILALIDAIRVGRARERDLAIKLLKEYLVDA